MTRLPRLRRSTMATCLAGAALLSGCTSGSAPVAGVTPAPPASVSPAPADDPARDPALARFYDQRATWKGCGSGFDCATVTVPVDWANPGGASIGLAVKRLPAAGTKVGSLLINPGGPGVSGLDFVDSAKSVFGSTVRDSLDIVGWDPRGVGESAPVHCLPNSQLDGYLAADATPTGSAQVADAVQLAKTFAASCERNSGALLEHVDTLSTVKDMDVLRAVLGDATLTYYGGSYGTFLGAWYAQEFPWRVGRFVLDGAVDPSLTTDQYAAGQAEGFQRGLRAYVQNCEQQSGCPLRGTVDQAFAQLSALIAHADQNPLTTSDGARPLTQSLLVTGLAMGLYDDRLWPALTKGIGEAMTGQGSTLLALADLYNERDSQGRYSQVLSANPAIYCLDHPEHETPQQIAAFAADLGKRYPPLGASMGWGVLGCAEWPIPAVLHPQRLTASGAAPIVVIGTTGDPATPYEWAKSLAGQLSSGRLLTWDGQGHTAYGRGSTCIARAVESYLVGGVVPANGTTCTS